MKKFEEAQEAGELETALKQKVMTTSVTSVMSEDCKKMLRLMGVPVIEVKLLISFVLILRLLKKLKHNVLQW